MYYFLVRLGSCGRARHIEVALLFADSRLSLNPLRSLLSVCLVIGGLYFYFLSPVFFLGAVFMTFLNWYSFPCVSSPVSAGTSESSPV